MGPEIGREAVVGRDGKSSKKIVYVDMDGVLVDFQSGLDRVPAKTRLEYAGRSDEIPGIYALMDPMSGALEAFLELVQRFDVYILSTAPWKNPSAWSDKREWVQRHLGGEPGDPAYKRLILTHHKDLNRGDVLIDDREKHGAGRFKGELIRFGSNEYPDWPAVMRRMRRVDSEE
jgi:5'-nucleotidase